MPKSYALCIYHSMVIVRGQSWLSETAKQITISQKHTPTQHTHTHTRTHSHRHLHTCARANTPLWRHIWLTLSSTAWQAAAAAYSTHQWAEWAHEPIYITRSANNNMAKQVSIWIKWELFVSSEYIFFPNGSWYFAYFAYFVMCDAQAYIPFTHPHTRTHAKCIYIYLIFNFTQHMQTSSLNINAV